MADAEFAWPFLCPEAMIGAVGVPVLKELAEKARFDCIRDNLRRPFRLATRVRGGLRGDEADPRLQRIKDMLLDTACEEIAHVEMVSTCVAMLLNGTEPQPTSESRPSKPSSTRDMITLRRAGTQEAKAKEFPRQARE